MKIIIDFDSTFTKVEALDELAKFKSSTSNNLFTQIKSITDAAMDGSLSFAKALQQRVEALDISVADITQLVELLKTSISNSITRNKIFFLQNAKNIWIVSGGFKEYITPVVADFGITDERVIANTFIFANNKVIGFDTSNPLCMDAGKVIAIKNLNFNDTVMVIGDGYTDYEIKVAGLASKFYCFTENVYRQNVAVNADSVISDFNEFIIDNNLDEK
jgi:D-3-phosphoglycerate dehydrogenase